EYGPFDGAFLGDNNHDGRVLMSVRYQSDNLPSLGIFELNTRDGEVRQILRTEDLVKFYDEFGWKGNRDFRKWKIAHVQYSTDAAQIAFTVRPYGGADSTKYCLFICNVDGSNVRYW